MAPTEPLSLDEVRNLVSRLSDDEEPTGSRFHRRGEEERKHLQPSWIYRLLAKARPRGGASRTNATPFVTATLADECKRLDLPFLDTVGNLYLRTDAFLVYIKGEPRPAKFLKGNYRAYQPAGLKVIFALLCRPTLVEAQYRELARFARVAFGAVGPILKDLERRGYLRKGKTTKLLRTKELARSG
jgi:hypothetical protein